MRYQNRVSAFIVRDLAKKRLEIAHLLDRHPNVLELVAARVMKHVFRHARFTLVGREGIFVVGLWRQLVDSVLGRKGDIKGLSLQSGMREDHRVLARVALEDVTALAAEHTRAKQEKFARVLGIRPRDQAVFDRQRTPQIVQVGDARAGEDSTVEKFGQNDLGGTLSIKYGLIA